MTNQTIKNLIRKVLKECNAPDVVVGRIKGIEQKENDIFVKELNLSMGICNGQEFESITEMRQQIEIQHNINIQNIKIDL